MVKHYPIGPLDEAIRSYLSETLGIDSTVQPWWRAGQLPYFLADEFDVHELALRDKYILLAIQKRHGKPKLAEIRAKLDRLHRFSALPVIYVASALASYERKRLIDQKVSFLVPGNQLYLRDLGIDLREYFRKAPLEQQVALSPSTQALLIASLLQSPYRAEWRPAELAKGLGYSAMTLSRAVRELEAAKVATVRVEGRSRLLETEYTAKETWEKARPHLRSPVKRRVWARASSRWRPPHVRLAGLSALSELSMLAAPARPCYALDPSQWKMASDGGLEILPEPLDDTSELEIWHYQPALMRDSKTVDPYSLTLSLQDNSDPRIQLALDELLRSGKW